MKPKNTSSAWRLRFRVGKPPKWGRYQNRKVADAFDKKQNSKHEMTEDYPLFLLFNDPKRLTDAQLIFFCNYPFPGKGKNGQITSKAFIEWDRRHSPTHLRLSDNMRKSLDK